MHVKTDGDEIVSTREHPFYVPVRGWTAACDLRAGDILVRSNGEYVVVEAIEHELLESPITVYNFEVEDFHTYHVGSASVLVHNQCVAREGSYRADVRLGGDPNHPRGHAHIYYGSEELASIGEAGEIIVGKLDRGAKKFVEKYLAQIIDGIKQLYYIS